MQRLIRQLITVALLLVAFVGACYLLNLSTGPTVEYNPVPTFLAWTRALNITNAVALKQYGHANYGGVAHKPIQEGDVLVKVPRDALISSDWVMHHTFMKDFTEWRGRTGNGPLLVWLIHERHNPHSYIKPFIDMLPQDWSNHPLTWSEEFLATLQDTPIPEKVNQTLTTLRRAHAKIGGMLLEQFPNEFKQFTFEDVLWAHLVVQTRSWQMRVEDGAIDTALVPWADMMNHKSGAGYGSLVNFSHFQIPATQNYAEGEQVFVCYGAKSNMDLLLSYGFVLEDNPDDATQLTINLTPKSGSGIPTVKRVEIKKDQMPVELMRVLRETFMEEEELEDEEKMAALEAGDVISFSNERQAVYAAVNALRSGYQNMGTTLEADYRALAQEDLSFNERNIYMLRKTQKEIIQNVLRLVRRRWESLLLHQNLSTTPLQN